MSIFQENEELRTAQLQQKERIQSLLKVIEELKQQQEGQTNHESRDHKCEVKDTSNEKIELQESSSCDEDQSCKVQANDDIDEDEKIKHQESSLNQEDQSYKMDLLAKVVSLETQIKDQRDLLLENESQLNAQARTIMMQDTKLREKQDIIQEQQNEINVLESKNKRLKVVLLRMEITVEKSSHLQDEYLYELTGLRQQTQEQASLLDAKDEKMKYLSGLCVQAQEAMDEDKATIADLKYEIQDLETSLQEQKEDLEECKQSLFAANQMITLTERRDSYMKPYVRRLVSYYRNKEHGSCFPLKIFGAKRQQSPAANIVNKLADVLLLEEQN